MSFPYNKILILGATSGIGKALAERILAKSQAKVVVTGRRDALLKEFEAAHGKDGRVASAVVDLTKLDEIEEFITTITSEHPDIDMIIHNAGIQRGVNFHEPATVDIPTMTAELATNYTSIIYLLKYALPHLLAKTSGRRKNTAIVFVTSQLGVFPMVRCGNYSASKAAAHQLIYTLREQLEATNVNIIEVLPPAVQTELHDAKNQPDIKDGSTIGMPLADFVDAVYSGLASNEHTIAVGTAREAVDSIEPAKEAMFRKFDAMFKGHPQLSSDRA